MIDNMSISNEYDDEGEIGEVDDFDSLDINFYSNKNKIVKNDAFPPSTKKPKLLTLLIHLQSRRDETT